MYIYQVKVFQPEYYLINYSVTLKFAEQITSDVFLTFVRKDLKVLLS